MKSGNVIFALQMIGAEELYYVGMHLAKNTLSVILSWVRIKGRALG